MAVVVADEGGVKHHSAEYPVILHWHAQEADIIVGFIIFLSGFETVVLLG